MINTLKIMKSKPKPMGFTILNQTQPMIHNHLFLTLALYFDQESIISHTVLRQNQLSFVITFLLCLTFLALNHVVKFGEEKYDWELIGVMKRAIIMTMTKKEYSMVGFSKQTKLFKFRIEWTYALLSTATSR